MAVPVQDSDPGRHRVQRGAGEPLAGGQVRRRPPEPQLADDLAAQGAEAVGLRPAVSVRGTWSFTHRAPTASPSGVTSGAPA